MNNKVFYQHPNLMRALGMHETVMEVMVNVLGGGGDSKVTDCQKVVAPVLISITFHAIPSLTSFCFFSPGDSISTNGHQLLSFSVLLLSNQSTEPALHVRSSELPVAEQQHRLGFVWGF